MNYAALEDDGKILQKFIKILEMTTSQNNAEALTAARMARKILTKYNTNYQNVFEKLKTGYDPDHLNKIHQLNRQINLQQKEITSLKNKLTDKKENTIKFLGPLQGLRRFMMKNISLLSHERSLLENIKEIQPKSKEAYLVLICARRYGVDYTATQHN